jgi:hypothetical protein
MEHVMKKHIIGFFSIFIMMCIINQGFSAEKSSNDVLQIIDKLQKRLEIIESSGNANIVQPEIMKIKNCIEISRKYLNSSEIDAAYYEISLAVIHFILIDAKIDNQKEKDEISAIIQKPKPRKK